VTKFSTSPALPVGSRDIDGAALGTADGDTLGIDVGDEVGEVGLMVGTSVVL
jgi:hypothetical protein